MVSFRGSCTAATTQTPTARPWDSSSDEGVADPSFQVAVSDVAGEGGELVDQDHDQRIGRGWFEEPGHAAERGLAAAHDDHGVLEDFGELFLEAAAGVGVAVDEPVEHGLAGGEFHAAFRVQGPQSDGAVADAGDELGDDRPQHRPFPGAGRPDTQDVGVRAAAAGTAGRPPAGRPAARPTAPAPPPAGV